MPPKRSQSSESDAADGRVPQRSQKRRKEILDAAAKVFFERGYDASSTQDIADAVGILKGSLYYYVESKEQFLYEIIKEAHDLGMHIIDEVEAADGDVISRLALLIHRHVEYFAANLIKVSVYFREYRALSPERRADIIELGQRYRAAVERLVRDGQADGTISPAIDSQLAGVMVVEMLNSISRWYHLGGSASPEAVAHQAATVLLGGLVSPGGRDSYGGEGSFRTAIAGVMPVTN